MSKYQIILLFSKNFMQDGHIQISIPPRDTCVYIYVYKYIHRHMYLLKV